MCHRQCVYAHTNGVASTDAHTLSTKLCTVGTRKTSLSLSASNSLSLPFLLLLSSLFSLFNPPSLRHILAAHHPNLQQNDRRPPSWQFQTARPAWTAAPPTFNPKEKANRSYWKRHCFQFQMQEKKIDIFKDLLLCRLSLRELIKKKLWLPASCSIVLERGTSNDKETIKH